MLLGLITCDWSAVMPAVRIEMVVMVMEMFDSVVSNVFSQTVAGCFVVSNCL